MSRHQTPPVERKNFHGVYFIGRKFSGKFLTLANVFLIFVRIALNKHINDMPNKLQELTDKLYQEGLSKGREEGERILSEAKAEAAKMIADAEAEASGIVSKAKKDAEDIRKKAESDVKMASQQCIQATKKDIENLVISKISSDGVSASLKDVDFLKELISSVAAGFCANEAKDVALVLPESLKQGLEPWVSSGLSKALNGTVKAEFSKKISGGFTIGPADGHWYVSLTDDTFKELFADYLRPVTRKILFGE